MEQIDYEMLVLLLRPFVSRITYGRVLWTNFCTNWRSSMFWYRWQSV